MPYDTDITTQRDRMLERPLPHNADAERALLGAIILSNDLCDEAATTVAPEDFYIRAHQFIYRAVLRLHARGSEINPILIGEELTREGALEQAGGIAFISELTYGLPHFTNLAAYAKVIKDYAVMRQLVKAANKITSEALECEDEADITLDHAEAMILELRRGRAQNSNGPRSYAQVWESYVTRQQQMSRGELSPIPFFDLPALNALTGGGMYEQVLVTVAALTSRGKSSLAKQIVDYNARHGIGAIYFSREMSEIALLQRSLAALTAYDGEAAAIPASQLRRAYNLDDHRRARVNRAGQLLAGWPVWVETHTANITDIYRTTRVWLRTYREWLRAHYPDDWEARAKQFLVVVDYTQLLVGGKQRYGTRAEEQADIWRTLKDMTTDLDARIIALAQFNNTGYGGQRPRLHQIAESGEAMKATNIGIVLWSDAAAEKERAAGAQQYPVKIFIDKQTDGPTGCVEAVYDTQTLEFYPPRGGGERDEFNR